MLSLQDKVAIITGSGRGIGRATAVRLAQSGARIVINDVDPTPAAEAEAAVKAAGGESITVLGSVADPKVADAMVEAALQKWNDLDILINNAGITRDAMIHRMTDEQYNLVMDVCVRGAFNCTRAAAVHFRDAAKKDRQSGRRIHRKIVNLSSIAGMHGAVGNINYASAKAALVGMTRASARELGSYLVNCNAVAPGIIETRMTAVRDEKNPGLGMTAEVRDKIVAQMPFGRVGVPEDVANAIEFLSSPASDFITGQVLEIHGGVEYINVVG